ncbi:hypothetical protein TB2_022943 [Malus domestica]
MLNGGLHLLTPTLPQNQRNDSSCARLHCNGIEHQLNYPLLSNNLEAGRPSSDFLELMTTGDRKPSANHLETVQDSGVDPSPEHSNAYLSLAMAEPTPTGAKS